MSAQDIHGLVLEEDFDADKLLEQNQELLQQNKHLQKEISFLREKNIILQSDVKELENKCLSLEQKHHEITHDLNSKPVPLNSISEVPICDLHANGMTQTFANVIIKLQNDHEKLSVSPIVEKQRDQETSILEALNLFCVNGKNVDIPPNKENVYFPLTANHVNELLLEIKTVIEDIEDAIKKSDVTLVMPHIYRLRRISNCLEKMFHNEIHKSKDYVNFDKLVENCVICIKKLVSKQEFIINSVLEKADVSIKGNKNLQSLIIKLKDLLLSCGFLKCGSDKKNEPENIFPFDSFSLSNSNEVFICDIAHDPMLKRIIVPLLPILNSGFSKLVNLNEKMVELQFILDSTQKFINNLISRVQDQEMHLKGVTKEIEEAQHIVSALKNEHKKLQYAEGILKYDLQEKRKLLTRLREQLENTREDFSRVRIQNSKSEAEWQDLHNEFLQRHKQSDAKSDFPKDNCLKNLENENYIDNSTASDEYLVTDTPETISSDVPHTKTRLEVLEEQCKNLYSSLLQSSRKRQAIDEHLDSICQRIEKRNKICSDNFSIPCSNESSNEKDTAIPPLKNNCQSTMLECKDFVNNSNKAGSLCNQNMSLTVNDKNINAPCISQEDSALLVKKDIIPEGLNLEIDSKTTAVEKKEDHHHGSSALMETKISDLDE